MCSAKASTRGHASVRARRLTRRARALLSPSAARRYFAYGGQLLADFIRRSSDGLASCVPHVAKLNGIGSCPARAAFDESAYGALRAIRLELSAAATNGSLTEASIPVFGEALSPAASKESASQAARDSANKLKRIYHDDTGAVVASHTEIGEDGEGNTLFPPPPAKPYDPARTRTDRSCIFGGANGSIAGQRLGHGHAVSEGRRHADAARAALVLALANPPPVAAPPVAPPPVMPAAPPITSPPVAPPPVVSAAPPVAAPPRAQSGDLMRLTACPHGCMQANPKLFGGTGKKGAWQCHRSHCQACGGGPCKKTLYCAQCRGNGGACKRRNESNCDPPCLSALHFLG